MASLQIPETRFHVSTVRPVHDDGFPCQRSRGTHGTIACLSISAVIVHHPLRLLALVHSCPAHVDSQKIMCGCRIQGHTKLHPSVGFHYKTHIMDQPGLNIMAVVGVFLVSAFGILVYAMIWIGFAR
eukprot:3448979-Amphidinium_carterae.1